MRVVLGATQKHPQTVDGLCQTCEICHATRRSSCAIEIVQQTELQSMFVLLTCDVLVVRLCCMLHNTEERDLMLLEYEKVLFRIIATNACSRSITKLFREAEPWIHAPRFFRTTHGFLQDSFRNHRLPCHAFRYSRTKILYVRREEASRPETAYIAIHTHELSKAHSQMASAFQQVSTQTFGYRILCKERKKFLMVKYEQDGTERQAHRNRISKFCGGHDSK